MDAWNPHSTRSTASTMLTSSEILPTRIGRLADPIVLDVRGEAIARACRGRVSNHSGASTYLYQRKELLQLGHHVSCQQT